MPGSTSTTSWRLTQRGGVAVRIPASRTATSGPGDRIENPVLVVVVKLLLFLH
jgi:hypothetical protein